nr:hypothetical protein [Tanacetum cinerariifolium]
ILIRNKRYVFKHISPTPLPDDPYVEVRQAHLVDTSIESGPVEELRETKVSHPLLVVPSPVLSSNDLYLIVGLAHTPATADTESKPEEASLKTEEFEASEPSNTRITSSHSLASSDSIAPLSPDHPLTQTSPTSTPTRVSFHRRIARIADCTYRRTYRPTLSSGMSAQIAEADDLSYSLFRKRYRSSYKTTSPSPSSSPTLPIQKRYQGTSELVEDTEDKSLDLSIKRGFRRRGSWSEDEGLGSEDEGPCSEDKGLSLEEEEAALEGQQAVLAEDTAVDEPLRLGYRALRRHELVVGEGEIPSTFEVVQSSSSYPGSFTSDYSTTTIAVDEDEFLERCRFRSLEGEQERATVTFSAIWRLVLALEAWADRVARMEMR